MTKPRPMSPSLALLARRVGWLGAGASALGALALFGCGRPGDRASSGCPDGETCSRATPNGLYFYGARVTGTLRNGPATVAIGGTQSIRFEDPRGVALPPHITVSSDPSILEVTSSVNGGATLRALAGGEARVRVIEPSGALLDRTTVRAAALDHVALATPPEADLSRAFAFVPGMWDVGLALHAADGERLVDESLVVTDASVDTRVTAGAWDVVSLQLPAEGATVTIATGGQSFDVTIPAAGPIDGIAVNPYLLGTPIVASLDPLVVSEGGLVCFQLLSGETTVIGADATFTYTIDGTVQADQTDACIGLPDMLGDTVTIEVSAAGLTRSFTLPVMHQDAAMALVDDAWLTPRPMPQLGDRALLVRGLPTLSLPSSGI